MIGYFISWSNTPFANISPLWSGNVLFLCISSLHHIYLVWIFMQRFNWLLDMIHRNQWWPSHVTSLGQKELNIKMYFEPSVVMMSKGGWGGMALTSEDKNNHLLQMTMASNMLQDSIKSNTRFIMVYADGLAQYCSNSIANTLELLQSCAKPLICPKSITHLTQVPHFKWENSECLLLSKHKTVYPEQPTHLAQPHTNVDQWSRKWEAPWKIPPNFFTWSHKCRLELLTHLLPVPHICVSESTQHWFR